MEETNVITPVVAEAVVKTSGATVTGKVKSFDLGKGYGFITQDDSSTEVFVHQESILNAADRNLAAGDRVSFEVTEGAKGPRAASVRKL